MSVAELTRKAPVTVTADATLADVARVMDEWVVGAVVVVEEGRPVGICTDRDLVVRAVARGVPADARVDAVMTPHPVVLEATAPTSRAVALFSHHPVRRLPLVEHGQLVGVLTVDDLLVNTVSDLAAVMRPVVGEVVFGRSEPRDELAEA